MKTRFDLSPKARALASRPFIGGPRIRVKSLVAAVVLLVVPGSLLRAQDNDQITQPFLLTQVRVVSTIPANGDLNPYGVATVPHDFPAGGAVNPGDILVSNFNNSSNLQGTGTTIMRIQKQGPASPFFQGTALAAGVLCAGAVCFAQSPGKVSAKPPAGKTILLPLQ